MTISNLEEDDGYHIQFQIIVCRERQTVVFQKGWC